MREILFRGKDKYTKEWRFGGIVHQTDFYGDKCDRLFIIDGTDTQDYDIGYQYEVIPETVGQFSGMYDRNRNKIFESDIVKYQLGKHDPAYVGVVRLGHSFIRYSCLCSSWHVELRGQGYNYDFELDEKEPEDLKVIGNIFDNPEYLNKIKIKNDYIKAEWIKHIEDGHYCYVCSCCEEEIPKDIYGHDFFSQYCPNCGSKMVDKKDVGGIIDEND